MERIKIELDDWECACCAIYTANVDLETAEKQLYTQMRMKYGYDDNDINKYIKGRGNQRERERFLDRLCEEEETAVLENGGVYYEDMDDDEYEKIMQEE